ncbi:2-hydroxy-3-oxopropionate reductase [Mesorhizobium sp. L-8-3]|nr:2-hydroxy-3-oxopropionate reductase [Mesorhizobium sp. L-8-3]
MKIGFIGLGVMGAPMARHLAAAGHEMATVLNRSPLPEGLEAKVVQSPADVARLSEVIITMLPDTPDVERVLFGNRGVAEGISAGSLVIDMSSISPIATAAFAARLREAGAGYLDAPVSGGEVGAKAASLTIMVGGPNEEFERALPIFERLGKNITLIGEKNGAGQTCKIANQIIVALNIEAVAEALVFASKAGCDPAKVRTALMGGFASSRVLEVHGERMVARTFAPGFRVRLH